MITKEEFEKAVDHCNGDTTTCCGCPLYGKQHYCDVYLTEYIKENEPAPAATGTDSKVPSNNKVANATNTNDITHKLICQAFESINVSGNTTLMIYESMTEDEQRAFDMGKAFAYLDMARDKLKPLKDGESDD